MTISFAVYGVAAIGFACLGMIGMNFLVRGFLILVAIGFYALMFASHT